MPGTGTYDGAVKSGALKEQWHEYASRPKPSYKIDLYTKEMQRDELMRLLRKAYLSTYMRPRYIFRQLMKISSPGEFIKKCRAGLSILKFR
jgi:hypothetical protein